MVAFILTFIRQHFLLVAELMLIGALVLQHMEVGRLNSRLAVCGQQNAMLMEADRVLSDLVDTQTMAITHLQEEAAKKKKAAALAFFHAQQKAKAYAEEAQAIEAYNASDNECRDMKTLLDEYFRK